LGQSGIGFPWLAGAYKKSFTIPPYALKPGPIELCIEVSVSLWVTYNGNYYSEEGFERYCVPGRIDINNPPTARVTGCKNHYSHFSLNSYTSSDPEHCRRVIIGKVHLVIV